MKKCEVCQSKNSKIIYKEIPGYGIDKKFNLIKCLNCRTVYSSPQLSPKALEKYYDTQEVAFNGQGDNSLMLDYKVNKQEYWIKLGYKSRVDEIMTFNPRANSLLDIGCGTGMFIDYAKNRKMRVYGLELSEWGYTSAKNLSLTVFKKPVSELKKTDTPKLDVIAMYDVLEHSLTPSADLMKISSLLNNKGLLIVNLPNFGSFISRHTGRFWNKLIPPNHTFFFTPDTLEKLVTQSGFEILSIKTNNGDKKEFAGEILNIFWVKLLPFLDKYYFQINQPFKGRYNVLVVLMKLTRKILSFFYPITSIIMPYLVASNQGEGIHLVARKK